MKRFRNVPAITTLLAGFVASVIMIIQKYSLIDFLWILVAVMASFCIAGLLIQFILNITVKDDEDEADNDAIKVNEEVADDNTADLEEDLASSSEENDA